MRVNIERQTPYHELMNILNQSKLRLAVRMICKAAKALGLELEEFIEIVEQEWDRE